LRFKAERRGIGNVLAVLAALLAAQGAVAEEGSKLIATGGALPLAGAAGGGIVPWALLSGYSAREQHGPTGAYTRVESDDYRLDAVAFSYNLFNRVELSAVRHELDIGALTGALGFDPGELEQDVLGAKVRLTGDAVFTRRPQVAAGFLHKRNRAFAIPAAVGARDDESFDYYVAATKVFLTGAFDRTVLLNLTLRSTEANQIGLLGFGGDRGGRETLGELSAAVFLKRSVAVGFEYRQKPNNLGFAREDDWRDLFVAYFPSKRFALVAAYADLGSIAGLAQQDGVYVSFMGSR
jgi:hypothetical protein